MFQLTPITHTNKSITSSDHEHIHHNKHVHHSFTLSTNSGNSSTNDIAVIPRLFFSNAFSAASFTNLAVAIPAVKQGGHSESRARWLHRFITPMTPATTSPCPPQRRGAPLIVTRPSKSPSATRSISPFWRMATPPISEESCVMTESPVYGREEGKKYEVGRVLLVGHNRVPESRKLHLVRR